MLMQPVGGTADTSGRLLEHRAANCSLEHRAAARDGPAPGCRCTSDSAGFFPECAKKEREQDLANKQKGGQTGKSKIHFGEM